MAGAVMFLDLAARHQAPPDLDVTTADIVGWFKLGGWLLFVAACLAVLGAVLAMALAYVNRDRARTRSPRPIARAPEEEPE
jgi:hypothetical protein